MFVYFLFDLRECHIWYLYNLARCSYQDPHYIIAQNITRSATFLNFHCLNQLVKAGGGSRACSLQLSNHLVCSDPPSHAFPGQQGIPSVFSVQCSVFTLWTLVNKASLTLQSTKHSFSRESPLESIILFARWWLIWPMPRASIITQTMLHSWYLSHWVRQSVMHLSS